MIIVILFNPGHSVILWFYERSQNQPLPSQLLTPMQWQWGNSVDYCRCKRAHFPGITTHPDSICSAFLATEVAFELSFLTVIGIATYYNSIVSLGIFSVFLKSVQSGVIGSLGFVFFLFFWGSVSLNLMAAEWEACKWVQHAPLDLGSQDEPQRSYDVCRHACSNFTTDRVDPPRRWCMMWLCSLPWRVPVFFPLCRGVTCAEVSRDCSVFHALLVLWPPWASCWGFLFKGWWATWVMLRSFSGIIFTVTKILSRKSYSFLRFVLDYCSDTQYIKRICFLLWLASTLANTAGFELSSPELTALCCYCFVSSRLQQATVLWFSTEGSWNKFPFPLLLPLRFVPCILLCVSSWKGVSLWCLGLLV